MSQPHSDYRLAIERAEDDLLCREQTLNDHLIEFREVCERISSARWERDRAKQLVDALRQWAREDSIHPDGEAA